MLPDSVGGHELRFHISIRMALPVRFLTVLADGGPASASCKRNGAVVSSRPPASLVYLASLTREIATMARQSVRGILVGCAGLLALTARGGGSPATPGGAASGAASQIPVATSASTSANREVATVNRYGEPITPGELALVRKVRDAAARSDVEALMAMCLMCSDPGTAAQMRAKLSAGGTKELARILLTHAEPTDGLTYPGFTMGGQTDLDRGDASFLEIPVDPSADPPTIAYHGMRALFEFTDPARGEDFHWNGVYDTP